MKLRGCVVGLAAFLLASTARAQAPDTATAAVSAAQVAARSWLALVDRGQYAASWDSAAVVFKKGITSAAWGDAVRQVRGPLDPFGARKLTSATFATSLPNAPPGQYVVIQFETKAARGKTVVETVTPVHEPDGAWRVSGYYVRPR